jgi:hypothetical protein
MLFGVSREGRRFGNAFIVLFAESGHVEVATKDLVRQETACWLGCED